MTALNNPKWERFAQELAAGKSSTDAYTTAGYKTDRKNAHKLRHHPDIIRRLSELLAERDKMNAEATKRATDALSIDAAWVLAELVDNARAAKSKGDFGPANKALELIGRHLGMFIERHELTGANGGPVQHTITADDAFRDIIAALDAVGRAKAGDGRAPG
ncbi:terminase small subunit [Methylocystis sp. WRRC1]|uniref:terminase small subunit n=1 Tax=Methylocystis sp. WRRC1 TaxID=1732014 RepID=UPI001D1467F2|nr:terminase small subunit [Methylocystis sp. WRRC1]MCC3246689.1 terminase small subunit [Methylocystis sp. WRRC1]